MAISPEVKPRASMNRDDEGAPMSHTSIRSRNDRLADDSNNSFLYALVVLVLIAVAYFAYSYYGQYNANSTMSQQKTTTIAPPVADPVAPTAAPSAAAPANPPATVPAQ